MLTTESVHSRVRALLAATALIITCGANARADFFTQLQGLNGSDNSSNYDVLYSGVGGHNLSITNVTVNGNIGVAGTGHVQDSGPSTINGSLAFSASNSGQYSNNNGSNVGPTTVSYGNLLVATDISDVTSLSATLAGESGTSTSFLNGNQSITIGTGAGQIGTLDAHGNWIVDVSGVQDQNGQVLTISAGAGFSAGQDVVFNLGASTNLQGAITLIGLTPDQIIFNVGSGSVSLNNNASSHPTQAWQGIILDPLGAISVVNANLIGRVYGGGSSDMQIVSGDTITAPSSQSATPEPATFAYALGGIVVLFGAGRVRRRRAQR